MESSGEGGRSNAEALLEELGRESLAQFVRVPGVVRDERGGARKTSSGGLNFHANPVKAREWRAQIPPQRVGCISLAQGSLLMHSGMFYL